MYSQRPLTLRTLRLTAFPVLLLLFAAYLAAPLAAQVPRGERAEGLTEALPRSPLVETIRVLIDDAGRFDWAVQGDWIAFDRLGTDGFYDVHLIKPDGSAEKCLTCELLEFRKMHALDPVWHPSGEYVLFEAQQNSAKMDLGTAAMTPNRGLRGEIWIIYRDGKRFWQLTQTGRTGSAVLEPHFSHEGGLVAFSERVSGRDGLWGEWALRVGSLEGSRVPRLKKVRTFQPGRRDGYVRSHGFSPNDRQLLISGNLEPAQSESGMDLYLFDLASGDLTRLTQTGSEWEELGEFSPDGELIAYTSNRNVSRQRPLLQVDTFASSQVQRRDLWVMRPDGSAQERLTFFNHPAAPESARGAVVGDLAWNPAGGEIAVNVITDLGAGKEAIYVVKLVTAPPEGPNRLPGPSSPSGAARP